jgi:hypothetical protein
MTQSHDLPRSSERELMRQAVHAYLRTMRELGFVPNRHVAFEGVRRDAWLLDDPAPHALSRRWLLLDDGDTWCETVRRPEAPGDVSRGGAHWVDHSSEALLSVLAESIADARAGGCGFLATGDDTNALHEVTDRRRRPRDGAATNG